MDSDQPISSPFAGNLPLNSPLSPYLNINPAIFKEPQYIMPEGSAPKRGRFELAFSTIGGAAIAGAFYGGGNGIFRGLKDPAYQQAVGWNMRQTYFLNNITKRGGVGAQQLGAIAFIYCGSGVLLSQIRGVDDELNTMGAGAVTGLLYKSTSGLRGCAIGGAAGFGLAAAWVLLTRGERVKQMIGFS